MAQRVADTRLTISSKGAPSVTSSSSTLRFATEHGKQSTYAMLRDQESSGGSAQGRLDGRHYVSAAGRTRKLIAPTAQTGSSTNTEIRLFDARRSYWSKPG